MRMKFVWVACLLCGHLSVLVHDRFTSYCPPGVAGVYSPGVSLLSKWIGLGSRT